MPLVTFYLLNLRVLIGGIPSSGKTTHAQELVKLLQAEGKKVHLINEENLNINKTKAYKDAKEEKMVRGSLLAEVERYISVDSIVVFDSLNYIKGYRYELFCRARSLRTPTCVIWCDIPRETTRQWNSARPQEAQWDPALLEDYSNRFEVPNPRNRWDRPLITIREGDKLPWDDIKNVLLENPEEVTRNEATEYSKIEEPNKLYEIDQQTQAIVNAIMEAQNNGLLGEIPAPKSSVKIQLKRRVSLAELSRFRRQYIQMTKVQPMTAGNSPAESFVIYLNANLF